MVLFFFLLIILFLIFIIYYNKNKFYEKFKIQKLNSINYYYSPGRTDRSGAQIHDILFAKAFCLKNNYKYIGCPINTTETKSLVKFLNITNNYDLCKNKFKCIKLLPEDYRKEDSNIFTPKIRDIIISKFNYKFDNIFTISIHLRRGDVNPNKYPDRYLYNKYYIDILNKILLYLKKNYKKNVVINVCSVSESFESLDEFKEIIAYKVNLFLDISLEKTYELMIHSDILILSRSSFSFVPAFYNKRCVIYYPFWHKKLNHWLDSTKYNLKKELEKEIKNLILKYHS